MVYHFIRPIKNGDFFFWGGLVYFCFIILYPHDPPKNLIWGMVYLVGGCIPTPLKNMTSSIGMMTFPIYGKIKLMFQTTNQVYDSFTHQISPIMGIKFSHRSHRTFPSPPRRPGGFSEKDLLSRTQLLAKKLCP